MQRLSKISDALTGWGTILGAILTALSLAVTLVVYEVRTAENVTHCLRLLDYQETRLDHMDEKVSKTCEDVAYLRGRAEPKPKPDLQARQ